MYSVSQRKIRKIAAKKRGEDLQGGNYDCHPTKKRTPGRLRHFLPDTRQVKAKIGYENLLFSLSHATGAF